VIVSTAENFKQPTLQYDSTTKLWRLTEDYEFEWGPQGFRKRLWMRAGFEYDKASVPRFLWAIARPDGEWEAAALFHDRMYRDRFKFTVGEFVFKTQVNGIWRTDSSRWRRSDADELLAYMGVLGGANPVMAQVYKAAVTVYPPNWFK
jgi:hypothetical protein